MTLTALITCSCCGSVAGSVYRGHKKYGFWSGQVHITHNVRYPYCVEHFQHAYAQIHVSQHTSSTVESHWPTFWKVQVTHNYYQFVSPWTGQRSEAHPPPHQGASPACKGIYELPGSTVFKYTEHYCISFSIYAMLIIKRALALIIFLHVSVDL